MSDCKNFFENQINEVIKNRKNQLRKKSKNFHILDGKLFYIKKKKELKQTKALDMNALSTEDKSGKYLIKIEINLLRVVKYNEKDDILKEIHEGELSGHSGRDKCVHRAENSFYWNGMVKDISNYISGCEKCNLSKPIPKTFLELNSIIPSSFFD